MIESRWYCVRVIGGKEKQILKVIQSEIKINKLEDYVEDLTLPIQKQYVMRNNKKYMTEKLVFPGYILLKAKEMGELTRVIKGTNGVMGFSGDRDGRPIAMQQFEVDKIFGDMKENLETPEFTIGQEVMVTDGPFKSMKGSIESLNQTKSMMSVAISIFGRKTNLDLNYNQVETNIS